MSGPFSVGLASAYGQFWELNGLSFEDAIVALRTAWAQYPEAVGIWSRPDRVDLGWPTGCEDDEDEAFEDCMPPRPPRSRQALPCRECGGAGWVFTDSAKSFERECHGCEGANR